MSNSQSEHFVYDDVPTCGLSIHPRDGASFEGRTLIFIWDLRDASASRRRSRLVIKKRLDGQSPNEAFTHNESLIEADVEFVQYLVLDVERLGAVISDFVWRAVAVDAAGRLLAASEIGGFSCRRDFVNLSGLHSDGPPCEAELAPPPKPKVAKGTALLACPNGDLEMGNLQNWNGHYGDRLNSPTVKLNNLLAGIVPGRHTIVTSGWDPVLAPLGVNLARVNEGSYAVRLGDSSRSASADVLAYTFTVTAQNKLFSFRYAVVLEDHGSPRESNPFFSFYILLGSSILFSINNPPIASRQIVADSADPFLLKAGDVFYRDWSPVCLDLGAWMGQTMTVVFVAADCDANGHFGYAYIDGLCLPNPAIARFEMPNEICGSVDLWADGVTSTGETSHFWSIEESDANGGRPNPQTEVYEWFVARKAGPINLSDLYRSKGGSFKCNMYYRVKLAVTNDCVPWDESVKILFVRCPPAFAGADACVSCEPNGKTLTLGAGTPSPGCVYSWSPATGLDKPNIPNPKHAHGSVTYPFTYTLTVADPKGCTAVDQVTLYCKPPTLALEMIESCCTVTLIAKADNYVTLEWSTHQAGDRIQVTGSGSYWVTATNPCGSVTKSVVVPATPSLNGPFPPVAAESKIGSYPQQGVLHIKDVLAGSPAGIAGVPHAYNATDYHLMIFDRWGQLMWEKTETNCAGFANWSIQWDGRNKWGNFPPQGQYSWRLELKNCSSTQWRSPKVRRFKKRTCIKWFTLFGIKLWCQEYDVPSWATEDVLGGVDTFTIVY